MYNSKILHSKVVQLLRLKQQQEAKQEHVPWGKKIKLSGKLKGRNQNTRERINIYAKLSDDVTRLGVQEIAWGIAFATSPFPPEWRRRHAVYVSSSPPLSPQRRQLQRRPDSNECWVWNGEYDVETLAMKLDFVTPTQILRSPAIQGLNSLGNSGPRTLAWNVRGANKNAISKSNCLSLFVDFVFLDFNFSLNNCSLMSRY